MHLEGRNNASGKTKRKMRHITNSWKNIPQSTPTWEMALACLNSTSLKSLSMHED